EPSSFTTSLWSQLSTTHPYTTLFRSDQGDRRVPGGRTVAAVHQRGTGRRAPGQGVQPGVGRRAPDVRPAPGHPGDQREEGPAVRPVRRLDTQVPQEGELSRPALERPGGQPAAH